MQSVYMWQRKEEEEFVELAAAHFQLNPEHFTYGELTEGSYFGVRWGLGKDCVLVFKVGSEPVNYCNVITPLPKENEHEVTQTNTRVAGDDDIPF